jgi:hypothetical protein
MPHEILGNTFKNSQAKHSAESGHLFWAISSISHSNKGPEKFPNWAIGKESNDNAEKWMR